MRIKKRLKWPQSKGEKRGKERKKRLTESFAVDLFVGNGARKIEVVDDLLILFALLLLGRRRRRRNKGRHFCDSFCLFLLASAEHRIRRRRSNGNNNDKEKTAIQLERERLSEREKQ